MEFYDVGGFLLQNLHCEAARDCVLLTGTLGTGSGNIVVANIVGNSTVINVIHLNSTKGNGNSVFLGITKNGATNTIEDDTSGVVISGPVSSDSQNAVVGIPQVSMPRPFGSGLAAQAILPSAYVSGQIFVSLTINESTAGAGCRRMDGPGGRDRTMGIRKEELSQLDEIFEKTRLIVKK